MKTKGKIYISGKIIGVSQPELSEKFKNAEKMLSARGFQVVNPIKVTENLGLNEKHERQLRLGKLSDCNHIYMLPCSVACEVVQKELDYALKQNFDIQYELENVEAHDTADNVHG